MSTDVSEERITIQDASAWILRAGVIASAAVMLAGLTLSFIHRPLPVDAMEHATFDGRASTIWRGVREGRGQAIIEIGIYLLVATPITRVVVSMMLFLFEEHDWLYGAVTFLVLMLTLTGLLFLR